MTDDKQINHVDCPTLIQFRAADGKLDEFFVSALLTYILVIDEIDKNYIDYILRVVSLMLDGWKFRSKSQDPDYDIQVQQMIDKELEDHIDYLKHSPKGREILKKFPHHNN